MVGERSATDKARILFLHGRPSGHPMHQAFGESVGAIRGVVDPVLRWQDKSRMAVIRYASWFVSALYYAKPPGYDMVISESLHFPPVIMRHLRLPSGRRTVALMSDETLYFLKIGRYRPRTDRMLRWALASYHDVICVGDFQTELAREVLADFTSPPRVWTVPGGISQDRMRSLSGVEPDLEGGNLLFIGNGPGGWRTWYKGLDLLLDVFTRLLQGGFDRDLEIVGEWDDVEVRRLMTEREGLEGRVRFLGALDDLAPALSRSSLYVHPARGEAFGLTIIEAMRAGVPAVVSEWTGAKEAVRRLTEDFVVSLDPDDLVRSIRQYFSMSPERRATLSAEARTIASDYSWERGQRTFHDIVEQILTR